MESTLAQVLSLLAASEGQREAVTPTRSDVESAIAYLKSASTATAPRPAFQIDADTPLPLLHARKRNPLPSNSSLDPINSIAWLYSSLSHDHASQALAILQSPSSDEDIAGTLLEIWGYDGFDQVCEAVARRGEIIRDSQARNEEATATRAAHQANRNQFQQQSVDLKGGYTPQAQVVFQTSAEIAAAKRARKLLKAGGKGKGRAGERDEIDLEEWERIREESLAQGPERFTAGSRVRLFILSDRHKADLSDSIAASSRSGTVSSRLPLVSLRRWRRIQPRWSEDGYADRHTPLGSRSTLSSFLSSSRCLTSTTGIRRDHHPSTCCRAVSW